MEFAPVGQFEVIGSQLRIDVTDRKVGEQDAAERKGYWVIAFVADSEVVLITGTERVLDDRLAAWATAVTDGLRNPGKGAAPSWHKQNECLAACKRGMVFAKLGTEVEKLNLLRTYHPCCNRSDR